MKITDKYRVCWMAVAASIHAIPDRYAHAQTPAPGHPVQQTAPDSGTVLDSLVTGTTGGLRIAGTDEDDIIALRLHPIASVILEVDFGNDGIPDLFYNRNDFHRILIDCRGGDDAVFIDESAGPFTDVELTTILGGPGNDTLLGGSGGELYFGGPGDDTVFMSRGADRFVWNPGDGNDLIDGGDDADNIEVNGGTESEQFTITANGTRVRFDKLAPAANSLDLAGCESIVLNANAGDDSLACTGNLAALIRIVANGGTGNDHLLGSNGADQLNGGPGNDFIDGQQGTDAVTMGSGDDVFQWDPGDGSDTIEGQSDHDTIVLNGSNGNENFSFIKNGRRLLFTRDLGNVTLDADGIEQFVLKALGGTDGATINDLSGTALAEINIDLAATLGGSGGDALPDTVTCVGTSAAEVFRVSADGPAVLADLATAIRVRGYEPADQILFLGAADDAVRVIGSDEADTISITANGTQARVDVSGYSAAVAVGGGASLTIDCSEGDDHVSCVGNLAAITLITIDGGMGDDTLLGSNGPDLLIGSSGGDFIDGQQGADTISMGDGDDVFQWDPGDGNDVVEGDDGTDAIRFNGSNIGEILELSRNGERLRFTRNIASITLDANGVEQFDLRTFGGADAIIVNDLSGTSLLEMNIDLTGTLGGDAGDAQPDSITVNGTASPDSIQIGADAGLVIVNGLQWAVRIAHGEANLDSLIVNGLDGQDAIDIAAEALALMLITANQ